MAENSAIEWTHHTFNPWWGCQEAGPGCDNCYARRLAERLHPDLSLWGPGSVRLTFGPKHWNAPLGWNRKAEKAGVRQRVFCASMGDLFDNIGGDSMDEERAELWHLIHKTPHLDWLLLTKRIGNVARMVHEPWMRGNWPKNAWLGATVVNQEEADRDIPKLLALPAPVRFLSIEPMLGPISLRRFMGQGFGPAPMWVICGGESGPKARPMHPDWARSLRDQCAAVGVPFLFKQWGEWGPTWTEAHAHMGPGSIDPAGDKAIAGTRIVVGERSDGFVTEALWPIVKVGRPAAGRLLDGIEHNGFPEGVCR
jgi:protein gp37